MSDQVRSQAIDPSRSCLVQAPAGSGKTELLTQRILKLLTMVEEPEEILALTFTRKAAAEMRGRVIEALMMAKPKDPDSHKMETWRLAQQALARSDERGWRLIEHPSRQNMMTLDSFTHALARQLPLLSGFGELPSPSTHVTPLYRDAAEQAVASLTRKDPERAASVLLHQDHNMVGLVGLVADMLGRRDQWLHEIGVHAGDPAALRSLLEQSLIAIMQQQLDQCAELVPFEIKEELPVLLQFAGKNIDDAVLQNMVTWPECSIELLPQWQRMADLLLTQDKRKSSLRKSADKRIGFPAGKEFAEQKRSFLEILSQLADIDGLADQFNSLRKLPAEPRFDDTQWQVLEGQLQLLLLANDRLQQLFDQSGEADFIEIAMRALRALEDEQGRPTDLLLRLDYRIRHILVDEFQDTSMLQMRLLHNLTEGWQNSDGTHRTLFMVGDPMQSIYRFRKAEVGLFLLAAANKAGLPQVDPLNLTRNFRSSPVIVDWVNRAFASIFPDKPDILLAAVEHAEADAALEHDGKVCLHLQREPDATDEAKAVVATIRDALDSPGQRIAVLSRSRRHLHAIMQTLTEADIAFRAVDILPLHERPETRLLRALLRALLHPADRESWAALLRAPCCGIDTKALHQLLAGDERAVITILTDKERLERVDQDARKRLSALLQALHPCFESAGHTEVRALLTTAWQRLGVAGLLTQDANGNIEAMLELIEQIEHGGQVDFALLDERLQKLYAAPNASPDASRVELLTMHGAKGLQWDVVILPGLGHGRSRSDTPLLAFTDIPVAEGVQPLIAVRGSVRNSDPVYDLVRGIEKVKENNELSRLLYVACTRAETELHLFGHLPEEDAAPSSGSLLALLLPDGIESGCFGIDPVTMQTKEGKRVQSQNRLTRIRDIAAITNSLEPTEIEITEADSLNESDGESEYFWAGAEAAPVGIAVHALLQRIGETGIETWELDNSHDAATIMKRALIGEGLSGSTLESGLNRCLQAVERTVASKMGRWILSGEHADTHNEWELWSEHGGVPQQRFIDRSFIDAEGTRWIIDYKTGTHEGSDLNAFLDSETERYRAQLEGYRELLKKMEPGRSIRMALYFPAFDGWREL